MKKAASIMLLVLLAATLLTACSSNNTAVSGGSTTKLSAAGGEGIDTGSYGGYGGRGGSFNVYPRDNTTVKISRSGSVDTSIDTAFFDKVISSASFTTGAVPMNVTTNMTISTYPSGTAGLTDGQFYLHVDSSSIYKYDAAGDTELIVTGIRVHPGVTLTFGLNMNNNTICPTGSCDTGFDTAQVGVNNDIWNQGTIKTLDLVAGKDDFLGSVTNIADGSALDKGSLNITSANVFLNDGMITTKGTDTTLSTGGWGGSISIRSNMAFVNRGTIDSSGGNGTDGGYAGYMDIGAAYGIWNTRPVNAKGGTGTDGAGGYGALIEFHTRAWQSLLYNSGTLNSSGGDGTAGGGNASGAMLVAGEEAGYGGYACSAFVNSGNLIGNGGNATTSGNGGLSSGYDTAPHNLGAFGCDLRNSGTIEMKGGNGKDVNNYGGSGGYLYVWTAITNDYNGALVAPGSILFGGNVLADGGVAHYAGSGGWVELYNNAYLSVTDNNSDTTYATNSGSIEVLGFSNVNLKGGKGTMHGGYGGSAVLYWNVSNYNNTNVDSSGNFYIVTPSSIYNDTDFDMTGGQGVAGNGGEGGYFFAQMSMDYLYNYHSNPNTKPGAKSALETPGSIENHGAITTKGGQGASFGGNAGSFYDQAYYNDYDVSIWMIASGNITNTGVLNASGGMATDTDSTGGFGYPVLFTALGNIFNSGAVTASGGYGSRYGGFPGQVDFWSEAGTNVNTAAITANGGSANIVDGYGSNGGSIYIANGVNGPIAASSTGTLSVTGGVGGTVVGSPGSTLVQQL